MKKEARKELLKLFAENCDLCQHNTKSASYCEKNCSVFKDIRHCGAVIWGEKRSKEKTTDYKKGTWSAVEIEYLKTQHGLKSISYISNKLNRKTTSVNSMVHRLKKDGRLKSNRKLKKYAVYRGENLIVTGTAEECAKEMNVAEKYISWLTTDAAKRRFDNINDPDKGTIAVVIDD